MDRKRFGVTAHCPPPPQSAVGWGLGGGRGGQCSAVADPDPRSLGSGNGGQHVFSGVWVSFRAL